MNLVKYVIAILVFVSSAQTWADECFNDFVAQELGYHSSSLGDEATYKIETPEGSGERKISVTEQSNGVTTTLDTVSFGTQKRECIRRFNSAGTIDKTCKGDVPHFESKDFYENQSVAMLYCYKTKVITPAKTFLAICMTSNIGGSAQAVETSCLERPDDGQLQVPFRPQLTYEFSDAEGGKRLVRIELISFVKK